MISLFEGDCLEIMQTLPAASVDMVLCDLPYGTTQCKWDSIISFDRLWVEYKRLCKNAIVLTASQPFTSILICSNLDWFKYTWVWKKPRPGGFVAAKLKPLKDTEDICVFSPRMTANGSKNNMVYNPQGLIKVDKEWSRPQKYYTDPGTTYARPSHNLDRVIEYTNYPRTIIEFDNPNKNVLHPTQKPVALMEYLIKTYTNEGDTVLDNCMGSGTTGVACINTGRNFIGIEKDPKYFQIAKERIEKAEFESIFGGGK